MKPDRGGDLNADNRPVAGLAAGRPRLGPVDLQDVQWFTAGAEVPACEPCARVREFDGRSALLRPPLCLSPTLGSRSQAGLTGVLQPGRGGESALEGG